MDNFWHNLGIIFDNRLTKILLVILVALIAQKILRAALSKMLMLQTKNEPTTARKKYRQKQLKTLNSITGAISIFIVWVTAILTILNILKLPLAPILTSAGLIGAAVAFGMQSIIKDFISGIIIIVDNQFHIDDYIKINNVIEGRVEAISIRTTAIRDENGSLHLIPNGTITTNFSNSKLKAREQLDLAADYSSKQFEKKLVEIAKKLADDPMTAKFVKDGPRLESVDKVTSKATTVTIVFTTTITKRKGALSAIWTLVRKEKIPLA
jgi:small conductance mechanosensitive channel